MPHPWDAPDYQPLRYSFVSLEGYLSAKLLVRMINDLGPMPAKDHVNKPGESP